MQIRDRVVELRRVRAGDLVPNPHNWRSHPANQASALRGLFKEIGIADALLTRELPDGRLQLIDGHLRADIAPDEDFPVLVLDLNEAEADKLLLTLDPLAGMATADSARLESLLGSVHTDDPAIQSLLDNIRAQERSLLENLDQLADPEPQLDKAEELRGEMEHRNGAAVACRPTSIGLRRLSRSRYHRASVG